MCQFAHLCEHGLRYAQLSYVFYIFFLLKGTCIIGVCSSTEAILNVHFCGEGTCDLPPLGGWMFQEHLVTIVFTGIHPLSISTLEGSLWFQGKGTFQHGAAKLIAKVVGTELLPC